ncbi:MAG: putative Zn-dependent oxidoreductase, NADPH:quinone reductase [Modestobacter sp.]|nr:putative Zn-dependent oxidoreductase, NADPH:quinone reductase [Modestobacter sp.]
MASVDAAVQPDGNTWRALTTRNAHRLFPRLTDDDCPQPRAMRAVQITRFGGPEVMDVVDLPDPVPRDGEQLFDISSSGVNFADTHHRLSTN